MLRLYWLATYMLICFFFFNLKECILDLFDVLCSENIQNCVENHASPEKFFRVIWEAVWGAISPQFGSNKSTFYSYYIVYWLLSLTTVTGNFPIHMANTISGPPISVMFFSLVIIFPTFSKDTWLPRLVCSVFSWSVNSKICKCKDLSAGSVSSYITM